MQESNVSTLGGTRKPCLLPEVVISAKHNQIQLPLQHTMPVRLGDDRREVVGEASSPLRFVAPRGDACWEPSRTDSLTTGFAPSGCTQQENMSFTQSQCSVPPHTEPVFCSPLRCHLLSLLCSYCWNHRQAPGCSDETLSPAPQRDPCLAL